MFTSYKKEGNKDFADENVDGITLAGFSLALILRRSNNSNYEPKLKKKSIHLY